MDYEIPRADLSPALCDLINKMLQYDPGQRISMEGIMHHEWFKQGLSPHLAMMNRHVQVAECRQVITEMLNIVCLLILGWQAQN